MSNLCHFHDLSEGILQKKILVSGKAFFISAEALGFIIFFQ